VLIKQRVAGKLSACRQAYPHPLIATEKFQQTLRIPDILGSDSTHG
jgi:hypothetical protein